MELERENERLKVLVGEKELYGFRLKGLPVNLKSDQREEEKVRIPRYGLASGAFPVDKELSGIRISPADRKKSAGSLSLAELLVLYEELHSDHPHLSLSCFAREAAVPAWKLRDARQHAEQQAQREQAQLERVREAALQHPTSGYRRFHQVLAATSAQEQPAPGHLGLHTLRLALGELDLQPPLPRRTRKKLLPAVNETLWPAGRRVQVDATRFSLGVSQRVRNGNPGEDQPHPEIEICVCLSRRIRLYAGIAPRNQTVP